MLDRVVICLAMEPQLIFEHSRPMLLFQRAGLVAGGASAAGTFTVEIRRTKFEQVAFSLPK
jgi:hypothetical protein